MTLSRAFLKQKEIWSRLTRKVLAQVKFEIGQIDYLLQSFDSLLKQSQQQSPDLTETTAIASVLHSYYNGLENIFLSIAKRMDKDVPMGSQWHRELLDQMTEPTTARRPVLTTLTANRLSDYLAFRHFFRHSYSLCIRLG